MFRPHCNSQFGFARLRILLIVVVAAAIAFWLGVRWQPERFVTRQQSELIEAIEERSRRKLDRLLAEDYRDQWEFSREDASVAMLDVGSQFILLTVTTRDPSCEFTGGRAVVSMKFQIEGSGSPIAHEVIRRTNRLKAPFVFTWEKQSFWPGSWRLVRIENPDLPTELYGYRPGDLNRRLEEAGF